MAINGVVANAPGLEPWIAALEAKLESYDQIIASLQSEVKSK